MKSYLLSLVMCGRNDDYFGNFLWRMETALNFNAEVLASLGRLSDVEYVVVDWGSSVPLHSVLRLNDSAKALCRFILVPPEVAARVSGSIPFHGALAINVGVRRARGAFIAQTGGDILYPEDEMGALLSFLEDDSNPTHLQTHYCVRQKNLPYEYVQTSPGLEDVREYVAAHRGDLPGQPVVPFLYGAACALILSRALWGEVRGLHEGMGHWGWSDADLKLRVCLKHSARILEAPPVCGYHLHHYAQGERTGGQQNPMTFHGFVVNGSSWGLAEERFPEHPVRSGADAIPVMTESSPPVDVACPRCRHFISLVEYVLKHRDIATLKEACLVLDAMILDALPGTGLLHRGYLGLTTPIVRRVLPFRRD